MVTSLLKFNPEERIKAKECFNYTVFDSFRDKKLECAALAPRQLDLKVDHMYVDKITGQEIPVKNKKYQSYICKVINKIREEKANQ